MEATPIYTATLREHTRRVARDYVRQALLPLLSCTHCGATPGQPCTTPSGRVLPSFHKARS